MFIPYLVAPDRPKGEMADAVVLSYHDSLLKESDVSLLTGPRWLNDRVIGFYLE